MDLQSQPLHCWTEENDTLTCPRVERESGRVSVDLRGNPEAVVGTDGLHAQSAKQDVTEHSHGFAPEIAGVAAFSTSSGPMLGVAFVELRPSASGPTLVRFRYIVRLGKFNVTRCR